MGILKIDLRGAYNLKQIRKGDKWKTTFSCQFGHFEYLVMLFNLTNTPAMFQGLVNDVFYDLLGVFCIVHLDNILIYLENEEDH